MKYLKTLYRTSLLSAFAFCAFSCGSSDPETMLQQAESYIEDGNYEGARAYCLSLSDTTHLQLTPSQLCRQAIIYARLAELDDAPREMANASQCFERASALNSDSVMAFINSAEIDDRATIYLILNLNNALIDPNLFSAEEVGEEYLMATTDSIL